MAGVSASSAAGAPARAVCNRFRRVMAVSVSPRSVGGGPAPTSSEVAQGHVTRRPEAILPGNSRTAADMWDMGVSAIALAGLERAYSQFQDAATRIATPAADPAGAAPDIVDLSAAAVSMLAARDDFAVNIQVLKTTGEMQQDLLNLLAPHGSDRR